MPTSSSDAKSAKPSLQPHLLLYAAAVVPILTGAIFRGEAVLIAGAIASVAMVAAWAFMTGVHRFFCALLLIVVALLCVTEIVVL